MFDNVRVVIENGPLAVEDVQLFVDKIKRSSKFKLKKVVFNVTPAYIDIRYSFESIPFERIRRIPLTAISENRAVNN